MLNYSWKVIILTIIELIDKRRTMLAPMIQHLTVLEEASISMEQSSFEMKDNDELDPEETISLNEDGNHLIPLALLVYWFIFQIAYT